VNESLVDGVERHAKDHLRFGPVPAKEIAEFEERIGRRLPPALTSVLETIGNGVFFGKEELLGPRRLMVHDIELLPDMLSVQARTPGLPPAWMPFHRRDGALHVVDLSPEGFGQVYSWPDETPRGDVGPFLTERLTPP
jgi:cell wall assembly regulator SMI1